MSVIPYNNRKKYLEIDRDGGVINFSQVKRFIGDRRGAAAIPFTNGVTVTLKNLPGKGEGTITLSSPAANQIQIAGSTTSPNFNTLGYIAGDIVIVRYDDKSVEQLTVSSVADHILTFTTNLTGDIGGTDPSENSSICLKPNVTITADEIEEQVLTNFQTVLFQGYFINGSLNVLCESWVQLVLKNIVGFCSTGWVMSPLELVLTMDDVTLYGQTNSGKLVDLGCMFSDVHRLVGYGLSNDANLFEVSRGTHFIFDCEAYSFTQRAIVCETSTNTTVTNFNVRDIQCAIYGSGAGMASFNVSTVKDLNGNSLGGIASSAVTSIRGFNFYVTSSTATAAPTKTAYGFHVSRGGKIHVFPNVASIDVDTTLAATMNGVSKVLKGGSGVFDGDNMFGSTGGGYITEG